jgi:gamma-glutamyl phosphate reductase
MRGVPTDEAAVALVDSTSPSSSSMLMASTSELTVVVPAGTFNLVPFLFFFFASAV